MTSLRKYLNLLILASTAFILGIGRPEEKHIFTTLPGTQPGSVDPADSVGICRNCHYSNSLSHPVKIASDWAGSMMAQSARDPIFYAALAVANKYRPAVGEFCIRCHSPTGWLAGRSELATGQALAGTDLDGVQCDYCHRAVDPLNPDSTVPSLGGHSVPGYGNGMHVQQRLSTPKRGPFNYGPEAPPPYDLLAPPHGWKHDGFQETSDFCGVCHDVSNPNLATDRFTQAPHQYGPMERTYSEWLMSEYATYGDSGTCQSCHMRDTTGYACVYADFPERTNLAQHDLTGGNTFAPDIIPDFFPEVDTAALQEAKVRATATLQRAADLQVVSYHSGDSVIATVKITNRTGHKLPTGYPDGRRMWINIVGTNAAGDTVFQSGKYDSDSADIIHDQQIKLYEARFGLTADTAVALGLSPGPSLHFALNDTLYFDNRIPPKGFSNFNFFIRNAQPVGATYDDNQYWDITNYVLPVSAAHVTATLYYQTMNKAYAEFLRDENGSNGYDWNQWGSKLYASWQAHGKSQPVVMNTQTVTVQDTISGVADNLLHPKEFRLEQNYPNPFNPSTNFEFRISSLGFVSLKVYDMLGREIATLVNERKPAGTYTVHFDGSNLPSGLYFYSLRSEANIQTKKMLLIR
jgi:hypothetical protein